MSGAEFSNVPPQEIITSYYQSMSRFWQPIAIAKDIPHDRPLETVVCGRDIVVAKLGDKTSAFENHCPHFQVKLSMGELG